MFKVLSRTCIAQHGFVIFSGESVPQYVQVLATRDVLEVRKNSHVVLDCTVNTSITDLKFSWTRDGQTLPRRKRVYTATNGSLIIEKFLSKQKRNDSGFYECLVSGENGTIIGAQVNVSISSKSFLPSG